MYLVFAASRCVRQGVSWFSGFVPSSAPEVDEAASSLDAGNDAGNARQTGFEACNVERTT